MDPNVSMAWSAIGRFDRTALTSAASRLSWWPRFLGENTRRWAIFARRFRAGEWRLSPQRSFCAVFFKRQIAVRTMERLQNHIEEGNVRIAAHYIGIVSRLSVGGRTRSEPRGISPSSARYGLLRRLTSAAALALVSWYLLVPPREGGAIFNDAPIVEWVRLDSFNSATECHDNGYRTQELYETDADKERAAQMRLWVCISSDDPRWKPK
jgi:hypothetical protein